MATATLVGSTGLVGSNILTSLLAHPTFSAVYAYSRRDLPNASGSTKLKPLTSTDTASWPSLFPPSAKIFFSGLGTTRAAAGSVDAQRAIDYDLNLSLAKAAKAAGVETYVLISSSSANSASSMAYLKMKGQLEDGVKALNFKHTVILKPGVIQGTRTESRPAEAVVRGIAGALRKLSPMLTDFWVQDAAAIARAAVHAGVQCVEDKREPGVWELGQSDIVALGKQ
ncbi:NAD dependent epimerase/dehydratase family protein-like protein [Dothidotthia symphoricarpi CBS 119687]|uniref:NAD dependent epimerase/dehydratase family protein-like protein n=1 Tax=Dothidotthia symphoricarpi CBS 119687 TaxID=1392245 RepID=A0A6A5ZVY2_9PLEO|nr:NAD dependent epimerase/dehydratase family protein-like protein [Dothidotthia symphoricarpi CBS 119687]KAF2123892.1 NAD dependent epimerase/dehydratase family protein-like protein [Dothidotthia symphoricarpi CBS 119687]